MKLKSVLYLISLLEPIGDASLTPLFVGCLDWFGFLSVVGVWIVLRRIRERDGKKYVSSSLSYYI